MPIPTPGHIDGKGEGDVSGVDGVVKVGKAVSASMWSCVKEVLVNGCDSNDNDRAGESR